jgi:hypothetical protein
MRIKRKALLDTFALMLPKGQKDVSKTAKRCLCALIRKKHSKKEAQGGNPCLGTA